jgi:hypothetical protein
VPLLVLTSVSARGLRNTAAIDHRGTAPPSFSISGDPSETLGEDLSQIFPVRPIKIQHPRSIHLTNRYWMISYVQIS